MKRVLVIALLIGWVGVGRADDNKTTRQSLIGLPGVNVLVEQIGSEAEKDGLTVDQIRTDVELRVRKAGIRVFNDEELSQIPGAPFLYVNVSVIKTEDRRYICSTAVKLLQHVTLLRDNSISLYGTTWDVGGFGLVAVNHMPRFIRDGVADEVDRFINAYLSVNPVTR